YNRTFLKPILAGMVAAGAALLMEQWLSIRVNIWYTVFHVFALLVSYGGTLLLLGLAPEEKTILMRLHRRMVSVFTSLHEAILNRLPAKLRTRKI
ncbi:MAG: hypothetical protein R3213_13160, partial [Flavobacteriaceae bacterium]|nr:hypothetical protein [Flavobacteriaceae bacterium]